MLVNMAKCALDTSHIKYQARRPVAIMAYHFSYEDGAILTFHRRGDGSWLPKGQCYKRTSNTAVQALQTRYVAQTWLFAGTPFCSLHFLPSLGLPTCLSIHPPDGVAKVPEFGLRVLAFGVFVAVTRALDTSCKVAGGHVRATLCLQVRLSTWRSIMISS